MQTRIIKSAIALTLVGSMILGLCGCAGTPTGSNSTSSVPTSVSASDEKILPVSDTLTGYFEEAKETFKNMADAVTQKNESAINTYIDKMLESLSAMRSESETEFALTRSQISEFNRPELLDRQQAYEENVTASLDKAEKAVKSLKNTATRQEGMAVINELFGEQQDEGDIVTLGNAYGNVKTAISSTSSGAASEFSEPTEKDLEISAEVAINDEIKEICDQLGTAKGVYEFVRNAIGYDPYYRSKKGAIATFEQCSGNDVDQASLLIGMLRYLGIPARYVQGTVIITTEQAMAITGATDAENAGAILASQYKPVSMYTMSGKLVGFVMEQVWVEAYVPYTDYRASGNKTGDQVWVSLDPSFKELKVEEITVDNDPEDIAERTEAMKEFVPDYKADEKTTVYSRPIAFSTDLYLPVSLPYTVDSVSKTFSFVPDNMKDRIAVSIGWNNLFNLPLSELYGQSIVVSFEPYSDDDRSLIESYGGMDKVPAYLVYVVPAVTIGDKVYKGNTPVTPGTSQIMNIVLNNASGSNPISDKVTAGSVYAITVDTHIITDQELKKSEDRVNAVKDSVDDINIYSGETLGPILDFAGRWYFHGCDAFAATTSLALDIKHFRQESIAVTGYRMRTESMFGYNKRLVEGDFIIDVDYNSSTNISYSGDLEAEKKYTMLTGMKESSFEGELWADILADAEEKPFGISTMHVFFLGAAAGVQSKTLTQGNADELDTMNISESAKRGIRNYLNAGRMIVVMPEEMIIGEWQGTAYIAIDPADGSGVYMISGGLAGGTTPEPVTLRTDHAVFSEKADKDKIVQICFTINYILSYVKKAMALAQLTGDLATVSGLGCTPEGVGKIVDTLCDAKAYGDAVAMYLNNLNYFARFYIDGETDDAAMNMLSFTLANLINFMASALWDGILGAIPGAKIGSTGYTLSYSGIAAMVDLVADAYSLRKNIIDGIAQASGLADSTTVEWIDKLALAVLP